MASDPVLDLGCGTGTLPEEAISVATLSERPFSACLKRGQHFLREP